MAILLSEHIEDTNGALEEARQAVLLAPADEASLRTLASVAEKGSRWTEMERALSDIIALAPRDLAVHVKLFDVLVKLDHVERAFASASFLLSQGVAGDRERALVAASRDELMARPTGTLPRSARDRLRWALAPLSDNDTIDRTARVSARQSARSPQASAVSRRRPDACRLWSSQLVSTRRRAP